MDILKSFSKRSFLWILFFVFFLTASAGVAGYFATHVIFDKIAPFAAAEPVAPEIAEIMVQLKPVQDLMHLYFIPVISGFFFITGILLWVVLRLSLSKLISVKTEEEKADAKKASAMISKKEKEQYDRRMFLHLFSVLQREGRLMDFFAEDLSSFEDDQIGAAVRNIHENCKKTVDKYLSPEAVFDAAEGDEVSVPEGFDASAVKLIGNVAGQPPFKGILRHKGWKASKTNLPELSTKQDSKIIAPAEVEIM